MHLVGCDGGAFQQLITILAIQPSGTYLLGGHSLGGMNAVEQAYHLEGMGCTVGLVLL